MPWPPRQGYCYMREREREMKKKERDKTGVEKFRLSVEELPNRTGQALTIIHTWVIIGNIPYI
jgi:hypothetical protein